MLNVGSGISASSLALALTGASVTGLEFDPKFIEVAKEFIEFSRAHLKQYGIFTGNISSTETFSYPDESFDVVFCANVLEKVKNPAEFIRELSRITKPGGIIIIRQRFSLAPNNLRRDPHYGLPIVAVLPKLLRKTIAVNFMHRGSKLREEHWPLTHSQLRNWISSALDLHIDKWSTSAYGRWPAWKSRTAASVIGLKKTVREGVRGKESVTTI